MRRFALGNLLLWLMGTATAFGAAPAAPSYVGVERAIQDVREGWGKPGAEAQPNAPGWNAFFDALRAELQTYCAAADENARLKSLGRIHQFWLALQPVIWHGGSRVRDELHGWMEPRIRLAWAERRLVDHVKSLAPTSDEAIMSNRSRWVAFVNQQLASALHLFDSAGTVADRLEALQKVYGALYALVAKNSVQPWAPSYELQSALNQLYNLPNLDISADVATLAPVLSRNIVETGPVYRKGYVSQVTAGPKTGFGLLASDEGISFYNSQWATSVTPIWDFQQQTEKDRRGRKVAKLYSFSATTHDQFHLTITATLTPNGLKLGPQNQHNVDALIGSLKQPGKGLGRFFLSMLGFNQTKITNKVYEGAIGRMREDVPKEAAEQTAEELAKAQAEQNAKLSQYLIGNNALAFRNLLILGLSLRSRPANALIGGTLQWRGAKDQVGAYVPQPARFAVPASGVSADLHLSSILTSLVRGYLQSDDARSVENLMVVTRKVAPNAPPNEGILLTRNADYAAFLKAVNEARAANDPKIMAVRVKRPGHSPEFGVDAHGFLVALIHDFLLEVPAPASAAKGGIAGPPAQVYRITAPRAEAIISFKITAQTEKEPVRLSGRIEGFDPGPGAQVYAVDQDEPKAVALNAFSSSVILGVFRTKVQGQPIDVPLSQLKLEGFAIRDVSPLDPSGWIRVNLVRTSTSPAAGIH